MRSWSNLYEKTVSEMSENTCVRCKSHGKVIDTEKGANIDNHAEIVVVIIKTGKRKDLRFNLCKHCYNNFIMILEEYAQDFFESEGRF